MATVQPALSKRHSWVVEPFYHPVVDMLFIGGGFTILLFAYIFFASESLVISKSTKIGLFILFNYAHFAASTVRLYTMPRGVASHRFVSFGLPVVLAGAVFAAALSPDFLGKHLFSLYLTWSPFHYAAQTYGLALMYSYRSGMAMSQAEKRLVWWICLLPFVRAFINPFDRSLVEASGVDGIRWLVSNTLLDAPVTTQMLGAVVTVLSVFVFVAPLAFFIWRRGRFPLISLQLILVNGLWLVAFSYFDAVVWATIAHSIQYLFIVVIIHVKDYTVASDEPSILRSIRRGPIYAAVTFYLLCILLGPLIFFGIPRLIRGAGGLVGYELDGWQCFLAVTAAINLHHFIVDGVIWRSKKRPSRE